MGANEEMSVRVPRFNGEYNHAGRWDMIHK